MGIAMKRVLIIAQNFYPEIGSAANRIKNIYLELKSKGYEVTVLTSEPRYPNKNLYKEASFWDEEGLEEDVIRIEPRTRKYTRNILNRLLLYLEVTFMLILTIFRTDKTYDYVFVSTPPIFMGIAGLFAKKRMKAKLVLDVRDLWPESLLGVGVFTNKYVLRFAYGLERVLYQSADHIIINSEGFASYIASKGVAEQKISFMPNSLTEEELHAPLCVSENQHITVIYTGNIGLAQDIVKLLDVAKQLQSYSHIKFKIIGYGFRRHEVERFIEEHKLTNVELVNAKTRRETLKEVAAADIAYVSLVEQEVFQTVLPGKIIDYMCMRKPIVGDVDGYAKDVIEKAGCGMVSKARTIEELCQHILVLADDEQLRKQLGDNGHLYAYQHLRWKNNIEALVNIVEEKDVKESMYVCVEPLHK